MSTVLSCDVPPSITDFAATRGRKPTTPQEIIDVVGVLNLNEYDVYVMGKRMGDTNAYYWTSMRIMGKESPGKTLTGYLLTKFISGEGFKRAGSPEESMILRPANIAKLVTDDTVAFKNRAFIVLNERVFRLSDVEPYCVLPPIPPSLLEGFESPASSQKRVKYAREKYLKNGWAHVNMASMREEQRRAMHKMLLPYMKNLSQRSFFDAFMKDMIETCTSLRDEFCVEGDTLEMPETPEVEEPEPTPKRPRETVVNPSLHRIDAAGILW